MPIPPLNSWQTIPVPPPTCPPQPVRPAAPQRLGDVLGPDVEPVDVVEVLSFVSPDDRKGPELRAAK